jgi:uncharacterized Fe-S center protein
VCAAYIDNFKILKAIDDRQQQSDGRPLWMDAQKLLRGRRAESRNQLRTAHRGSASHSALDRNR